MTDFGPGTVRRHARAVVTLSAAEIAGKIATLLTFVIIARSSSVADYGLFAYGLSLGLLLAVFTSMGLDSRLIQLAGRAQSRCDALLTTLVVLRCGAIVVLSAGMWAVMVATDVEPMRRTVFMCLLAAAVIDTINDAFRAAASVYDHQQGPAVVLVVQRFVTLGLVAILTSGSGTIGHAAVAYLIGTAIGAAAMAAAARRAGARFRLSTFGASHARAFATAIPVYGGNALVSMALFRIDTVILALLASDVAVGHYSAAYRLIETALFISWSLSRVITPILAREGPKSPRSTQTLAVAYKVIAAVYLPYGMILLAEGDAIVTFLFGAGFQTTQIFVWLALAPLLFGLGNLAATALLAWRPDGTVLLASGLALVANVALNFVLIPQFVEVGAAAATSLAFIVQIVVTSFAIRRYIVIRELIPGLIVTVASSLLMLAAIAWISSLWVSLAVGATIYLAVWWAGTRRFDPATAELLRSIAARRIGSTS